MNERESEDISQVKLSKVKSHNEVTRESRVTDIVEIIDGLKASAEKKMIMQTLVFTLQYLKESYPSRNLDTLTFDELVIDYYIK